MRKGSLIVCAVVVIAVGPWPMVVLGGEPGGAANSAPTEGYSSPQEAFNAMRSAGERGDWRTVFLCRSPASRDADFLETFDRCCFHTEDRAVRAVMRKYGLDNGDMDREYRKRYREARGVDLPQNYLKVISEEDNKKPKLKATPVVGPPPPDASHPLDERILAEAALRIVTDKAGFYEEATKALVRDPADLPKWGDLHGVVVSGDSATGWADITGYYWSAEGGGRPEKKVSQVFRDQKFGFRKSNGRWFVE
jgi:hypothetical protein